MWIAPARSAGRKTPRPRTSKAGLRSGHSLRDARRNEVFRRQFSAFASLRSTMPYLIAALIARAASSRALAVASDSRGMAFPAAALVGRAA